MRVKRAKCTNECKIIEMYINALETANQTIEIQSRLIEALNGNKQLKVIKMKLEKRKEMPVIDLFNYKTS